MIFSKKKVQQPSIQVPSIPPVVAPASAGIAYYPELIKELVADHHRLLNLHEGIRDGFARGDLPLVSARLKEFGMLLRNHLLTENMRLYIYLQQKAAGDEVNTTLVRSFRKEMDGIAKTGLKFLEKYDEIESKSEGELASFAEELDQIGSVVNTRMQREVEMLFPLYAANY